MSSRERYLAEGTPKPAPFLPTGDGYSKVGVTGFLWNLSVEDDLKYEEKREIIATFIRRT